MSSRVKAKKFVLQKHFDGLPKEDDLKLVEEELPNIKDGEFLTEAIYLSVDPYMRAYANRMILHQTMIGCQVAKIIESRNGNYPVGRYVSGHFGWTTHFISNGTPQDLTTYPPILIPETSDVPLSYYLGMLGRTGNSAYFGLLDICKPQSGETVVINAAGGAVGSHAGQLAKIKGCTVIGITGSDQKKEWIKKLGFDHVINYKTKDVRIALSKAAPKGVDCFFDNVGGEMSSDVIQHMNQYGRITVCGSISSYNSDSSNFPSAKILQPSFIFKELSMKGFVLKTYLNRWNEGVTQNLKWYKEGKLKTRETITEGLENAPKVFIGLFKGDNIGKAIIKI